MTQSFGSQDYYKKSRGITIVGLAGLLACWLAGLLACWLAGLLVYYSAKTNRHRQNGLSYVPKKILTWMLREARGGLKATVSNRVKPDYHLSA